MASPFFLSFRAGSGCNHSETCAGCIVSLTTPTRSSLKASRSVSSLRLVGVVGLAVFREVDKDLVQIMLTVFSTVAGILAGFKTGQAVGTSSNR